MNERLFAHFPRATLDGWARRLTLFRFVKAAGGHANDGDSLVLRFHVASLERLLDLLTQLGLEPEIFDRPPPRPVVGERYAAHQLEAFPSLIPTTRWIAQPGRCSVLSVPAFVWCDAPGDGFGVRVSLSSGYEVTETDVEQAARLEPSLRALPFDRVDPPVDDERCLCPEYYPELFA